MSEQVMVVSAGLVAQAAEGRPFWPEQDPSHAGCLAAEFNRVGTFLPRQAVETDERWRQVIPYLLLRSTDGRYFSYRRLPAGGEARLYDRHSLGVGGHINDGGLVAGLTAASPVLQVNHLAAGLQRELAEELALPAQLRGGQLRLLGYLALDETPVDRVHVGVVVVADIPTESIAECGVRETDKLAPAGWHRPAELVEMMATTEFEGWSRTLIVAGLT